MFESNLANYLIQKYALSPPVDIFTLAKNFADIEIESTPPGIDGLCLYLKQRDRKPLIILNKNVQSKARVRFTLAHELGHVLIPWHLGDFVDQFGVEGNDSTTFESEANRFASELLLPGRWVRHFVETAENPAEVVAAVARRARVSIPATLLKVTSLLPPGYVFVLVDDKDIVTYAGISPGSRVDRPQHGARLDMVSKRFGEKNIETVRPLLDGRRIVWWKLPGFSGLNKLTTDSWKNLLEQMLIDICISEEHATSARHSFNGILGSANSKARFEKLTSEELRELILVQIDRKTNQTSQLQSFYVDLRNHSLFDNFLKLKIIDLMGSAT